MARIFSKTNLASNNRGTPNLKVKLFGQWDEALRTLQRIGPEVKEGGIKAQMKVANQIVDKIKGHIYNQDLGWAPLSQKYIKRKQSAGLYTKTLMGYGIYYNSIQAWRQGSNHLVLVGVKRGVYTYGLNGKRSKMQVSQIALMHEFGSGSRVPKRPLWNPTIKELGGSKGIQKMLVKALVNHLRVRGIKVSTINSMFG